MTMKTKAALLILFLFALAPLSSEAVVHENWRRPLPYYFHHGYAITTFDASYLPRPIPFYFNYYVQHGQTAPRHMSASFYRRHPEYMPRWIPEYMPREFGSHPHGWRTTKQLRQPGLVSRDRHLERFDELVRSRRYGHARAGHEDGFVPYEYARARARQADRVEAAPQPAFLEMADEDGFVPYKYARERFSGQ